MSRILDHLRQLFRPSPSPSLSCEDVNQFLVNYTEGTLPLATQTRFEAHLSDCPCCENYVDQYRTTVDMVKQEGCLDDPPNELIEHTLAFLRTHYAPGTDPQP